MELANLGEAKRYETEEFEREVPELYVGPEKQPQRRSSRRDEEKRAHETRNRRSQGGRYDFTGHLRVGLPQGYRLSPEHTLSQRTKLIRTKSLIAASGRRKALRDRQNGGTTVHRLDGTVRSGRVVPERDVPIFRSTPVWFAAQRWREGERPPNWFGMGTKLETDRVRRAAAQNAMRAKRRQQQSEQPHKGPVEPAE